jgi:hypothetical protein
MMIATKEDHWKKEGIKDWRVARAYRPLRSSNAFAPAGA